MSKPTASRKATLILSDDKHPSVKLKPGQKFEVISVELADESLKKATVTAARLCGGTTTCVTLIETE